MYRTARGTDEHSDQTTNMLGHPALSMGNPFFAATLRWNAQAFEGFGTVASEWQDFVRRRLEEDFALMQRVAGCRAPDQVWSAYADFWQKAAEDYGKEVTTITKLMAGTANKMVASAERANDDARMHVLPTLKAA